MFCNKDGSFIALAVGQVYEKHVLYPGIWLAVLIIANAHDYALACYNQNT